MIELRTGTKIWIAAGVTDMRRGFDGLSAQVQTVLHSSRSPVTSSFSADEEATSLNVSGSMATGLVCFAKRLERGRFIWPQATEGTVCLTRAQLSMLLEGIDWRRPQRTWTPEIAV